MIVYNIPCESNLFLLSLEFENKYYAIGEKRLIVKDTKVENENFYLLTLAAIAMELRKRETCSNL